MYSTTVLVLSDAPRDLHAASNAHPDRPGLTASAATSAWVAARVRGLFPRASGAQRAVWAQIFEQELCADADRAVLNRFSAFSDRIAALRAARNRTQTTFWMSGVVEERAAKK